ncbi:unnamed protein product [Camellia sinensis]
MEVERWQSLQRTWMASNQQGLQGELPEGNWYCSQCTCQNYGDLVDDKEALKSPSALKYHEACLKDHTYREVASDTWFYSKNCQEGLRSRVGIVNLLSDGFCWNLLRCIHGDQRGFISPKVVVARECVGDHSRLRRLVFPVSWRHGLRVLASNPRKIMRGRTEYYQIDGTYWNSMVEEAPFRNPINRSTWSVDNPNETGACSKGGPIDDLTRQLDGSPSPKEVVAQTETGHTDSEGNNMQVDKVEDEDATLHEHFSKLSC